MPTFQEYKEYTVNVDIDVNEFLEKCDDKDIEEVIDYLIDTDYIDKNARKVDYELYGIPEIQYRQALEKLKGKWNMLSEEEEQAILKIASRF